MKQEQKPLTVREKFVIKELRLEEVYKRKSLGHLPWDQRRVKRTPAEARSILRSRAAYSERQRRAYTALRSAMVEKMDFDKVHDAYWDFRQAMKFQGYLKMAYVIAMARTEGKSEDEIEQMMLLEVL